MLSLYVAGFFLYHCLPATYVEHVNYSITSPAPIPFQKQCACAVNPRSVYNSPLGNPVKLEEELSKRGLHACYLEDKARGYRDMGLWKWLAYFSFEYIPKRLSFHEPSDPYSVMEQIPCSPLASDMPIVISLWKFDIPNYSFTLGKRKNLYYSGQCGSFEAKNLIPFVGKMPPQVYAYSSSGFFFPGEGFRAPAVLSVSFFERRVLIFLLKDGEVYKVFDQRSIRESVVEKGSYSLYAYTYSFHVWRLYFGLRFLLCTPAFQAT
ncbi:MAG: hypothetical protein WHS43_06720 [Aquificaceae bacterium]|uniref:hypothetical protein n=1 Tax=Hydrogenobacter sp. Uz 6-8 TaxID=3384828 RepID=UPI0030AEFF5C